MKFDDIGKWMGEHPWLTGGAIVGGGLGLLWLFGFFSSSTSSTDTGQTNMAAAYYAAEAAQAAAGAQIQAISLQTTAATAQDQINANAAVAINGANTGAATTINQQNTGSANTIAGYGETVGLAGITGTTQQVLGVSSNQLQATQINANAATTQNQSNNTTAASVATTGANAGEVNTALQTIIPQEIAMSGGYGNFILPGAGYATVNTGAAAPINQLISSGYTPAMAAEIANQQQFGNPAGPNLGTGGTG